MKHTPGPWHTNPLKSFYVFAHGSLAEQAGVNDGPFICNASTQANARLIAAAPELLYIARWLMQECDEGDGTIPDGLYNAARAAIARADQTL